MSRWLLASLVGGLGLACAAFSPALTLAQDRSNKERESSASRDRDDASENPSAKIDKAIRVYENRTEQELDQARKDVDRLRKELSELIELRIDMAIALAQLRAEINAPEADSSAGNSNTTSASQSPSTGGSEISQRRQRAAELTRELRQLQDSLRAEVQQTRTQADQWVEQLRALRVQQRQRQEQIQAERDRIKKAEEKAKEDAAKPSRD